MPTLFVLDVPEFRPLVLAAEKTAGTRVTPHEGYVEINAGGVLTIHRRATGLRRAVWYGALTGGYDGELNRFDDEMLVISDPRPS